MNTLVGIDVQSIDEVATSLANFGSRYTRRLFTSGEVEIYGTSPATAPRYFAACFAAKEATLKILDVRDSVPSWKSIAVRLTASGKAEIVLDDMAAALAHRQGIEKITLDVSHCADFVIATVVAQAYDHYRDGYP